jgi:hypothetical protein
MCGWQHHAIVQSSGIVDNCWQVQYNWDGRCCLFDVFLIVQSKALVAHDIMTLATFLVLCSALQPGHCLHAYRVGIDFPQLCLEANCVVRMKDLIHDTL